MEHKVEVDFNFNKKTEQKIELKPLIAESNKKRLKFISFLIIGGLSVGIGLGVTNNLMKGYTIEKNAKANMEEIKFKIDLKNDQIRKNKENEVLIKANEEKKFQEEKLSLLNDKEQYNILLKNKEDMIKNYELQLNIYNKAYQNSVQAVKDGLISLSDLREIRALHQDYKKNITEWMNYVNNSTVSFEIFHMLSEENKLELKQELLSYQSGSLKRSPDLENNLIDKLGNDEKNNIELQRLRNSSRNKMIDDLANIMKSNNPSTIHKKLKR